MKIEIYSDRDIEPHRFNRLYTQFLQQNNGQIQNKIGIEWGREKKPDLLAGVSPRGLTEICTGERDSRLRSDGWDPIPPDFIRSLLAPNDTAITSLSRSL